MTYFFGSIYQIGYSHVHTIQQKFKPLDYKDHIKYFIVSNHVTMLYDI